MTHVPATIRLALVGGLMAVSNTLSANLLSALWDRPPDPVIVSSTADDDYSRQKFGAGAPKPETYLFFQGKYFGGTIRDVDLEHTQFSQIVQTLGKDLVHQNYFPSKDPKNADLLIVVHWGTTEVYQTDAGYYVEGPPLKRGQGESQALRLISEAEHDEQETNIEDNAVLLGLGQQMSRQQYQKENYSSSSDVDALLKGLSEERYFVILMAYDYRTMKKGVKPRLLWSTRFSMRGAGNTFTAALPMMSRVAENYFGHADGIKNVPSDNVHEGKVEVGMPTVLDEESGRKPK